MSMTTNPASTVEAEAFTVRRSIRIAAPIDAVWRAVTEPEHISRWFGATELDGCGPGARGTMTWEGHGPVPLLVVESDAPHRIAYRWNNDDASDEFPAEVDERSTVFTFTLEREGAGTRLTVVETGFDRTSDPAANMRDHAQGWVGELDKLVALLEGAA